MNTVFGDCPKIKNNISEMFCLPVMERKNVGILIADDWILEYKIRNSTEVLANSESSYLNI